MNDKLERRNFYIKENNMQAIVYTSNLGVLFLLSIPT